MSLWASSIKQTANFLAWDWFEELVSSTDVGGEVMDGNEQQMI
jgi:hypothetical protein